MVDIILHRLWNQHLESTRLQTPPDVVRWMGAVQAQEYPGAKWALALRLNGMVEADMDRAFDSGEILRTHAMRPTWHFVMPEDIRWIQMLTAPRVKSFNAYQNRPLELDDALLARTNDIIAGALVGGNHLTREEISAVLEREGIIAKLNRLAYILHHAELDAIICSGARRGKQFTYALVEERAPNAKTLSREEALAELTRRYFTSHAPATVHDFSWWSGLTIADVREGIALVGDELLHEEIDGSTYYFTPTLPSLTEVPPTAYLLPTYDEYLIGYTDRSAVLGDLKWGDRTARENLIFDSTIIISGQIVGAWKRTFSKKSVVIEIALARSLTDAEYVALDAACERFGTFLGMPVIQQFKERVTDSHTGI